MKAFVSRFLDPVAGRKVGEPLDSETDLGPLVSADHREKVEAAIERGKAEGGTVACGGGRPRHLPDRVKDGFFSAELLMPSASELESLQLLVFIFSFLSRHDLEIQERKILQNLIFTVEKLLLQLRTIAGVERHVSKQHFSVY